MRGPRDGRYPDAREPERRGDDAYVHPVPIPLPDVGKDLPGNKAWCERQYRKCYVVCRRYQRAAARQRALDCKYDCYRQMRACFFWARPRQERFRPFTEWKRPGGSGPVKS